MSGIGVGEAMGAGGGAAELARDAGQPRCDEVDVARAQEYDLLAALLRRAPDAALLSRIAGLGGDETPLGRAHAALADAAGRADAASVEQEFFDLFIGVGRGELLPYGSYYLTGFLHERPLARLRADLRGLGIERVEERASPRIMRRSCARSWRG